MKKRRKKKKEGVIETLTKPFIPEFKFKDVLQVIIGAAILSVPVGFTQETWDLGLTLPLANILGILVLSLLFISMFTYYYYHRRASEKRWTVYVNRVLSTYAVSFLVVAVILGLIQVTPWASDFALAFKRAVIVTFPASLSAAIADTLK